MNVIGRLRGGMRQGPRPLAGGVVQLGVGILLLALLCAAGLAGLGPDFAASWLVAWWFWAGLVLGAQATLWMQRLSGGLWIVPLADTLNGLRAGTPALAILVLPLLACLPVLYPWARTDWVDDAHVKVFRDVWFQPLGYGLRVMVYVLLWTLLAGLDGWGGMAARRQGYAAAGLLLYAVSISLAAVDLLMSLTPAWYSTAFGLALLMAQLQLAMAAATYRGAHRALAPARNDLGNLLLMYVLTWAYIAFTQFQIIWAENMVAEISWYVPRVLGPWRYLGLALAVFGFALPLALLLFRSFKRNAACLRALALLLLVVGAAQAVWWVFPSVAGIGVHAVWMTIVAWAGMGLVVRGTALCLPTRLPPWPEPASRQPRNEDQGGRRPGGEVDRA